MGVPQVGLNDVEEHFLPYRNSNSDPSVVLPVTNRYTDCTVTRMYYKTIEEDRKKRLPL
jgi:hypothetical protein